MKIQNFIVYLHIESSLTSLINTITKLITLLCRDGVTNVMAAWIDSKLLGYNSVAEMDVILSYTVVRFYLSQQISLGKCTIWTASQRSELPNHTSISTEMRKFWRVNDCRC